MERNHILFEMNVDPNVVVRIVQLWNHPVNMMDASAHVRLIETLNLPVREAWLKVNPSRWHSEAVIVDALKGRYDLRIFLPDMTDMRAFYGDGQLEAAPRDEEPSE